MIVVHHLNNSGPFALSKPRNLGAPFPGIQRTAPRSRPAPMLSRSKGRRQAAAGSSIASSVGVALSDESRCALARNSDGSLP
jgi:hypothetical protein